MKIKLSAILLIILLCNCTTQNNYYIKTVPSVNKQFGKVAVIPENWDYLWISSFAYRALITELMDVGFHVIERSNLETILDEKKLQLSGVAASEEKEKNIITHTLDRTTISQFGELLGVKNLILIYVVPSGRKVHLGTIRLVDVETAQVVTSTTFVANFSGQDTDVIMKQVAFDIVEAIRRRDTIIRNDLLESKELRRTQDRMIREK